jgi:outer membrane protein insertion porin family
MKRLMPYAAINIVLFMCQCSAIKFLPEKELYYDDTKILITGEESPATKKRISESLISDLYFRNNRRVFGSRPEVWSYHISGNPSKSGAVRRFFRTTLGSTPVYLSDAQPKLTAWTISTKLTNAGYFGTKVIYDIQKDEKKRSSKIIYNVALKQPYMLGNIEYPCSDSVYAPIIKIVEHSSLLKTGQRYDLETLKQELIRIEKEFKDNGYYFFTSKFMLFEADSTGHPHIVDLRLKLSDVIPEKARKTYKLNKPTVYFEYPARGPTAPASLDTLSTPSLDVIYNNRHSRVKPGFLAQLIAHNSGDTFSTNQSKIARSLLMDVGLFQSLNIRYASTAPDSGRLNPYVFLTFEKKISLTSDLKLISKSNGTIGPSASSTFTNRNLFGKAEEFDFSVTGAYETQISSESSGSLDAFEVKLESSLLIRRLLLPLRLHITPSEFLPSTILKSSLNFQNRIGYYDVKAANASIGYNWKKKEHILHEFFPVDMTYVKTDNVSSEFYDLLAYNPNLAISLQDQFIIATRYRYTFRNNVDSDMFAEPEQQVSTRQSFVFRGTIEQSGNLLEALMTSGSTTKDRPYTILGSPYSQYVKLEADFRYYWTLNKHQKIATNLVTTSGFAFGNSTTLPYVKQYSIGGASSLRAFAARTIGPGSYNRETDERINEDSITFSDQYGDIKLQGNIEYRFDIFKLLKGALFVDAGNIWTFREDSTRAGSQFKPGDFYKQIAVGAGVGLRLALGVLLLRFDTAVPLRQQDVGWVIRDMQWDDSAWRNKNIVFTIAVGYPF